MTNPEKDDTRQAADYETVVRLLQTTREKLTNSIIANTELETLLSIERDKSKVLQTQLDALLEKDKPSNTK